MYNSFIVVPCTPSKSAGDVQRLLATPVLRLSLCCIHNCVDKTSNIPTPSIGGVSLPTQRVIPARHSNHSSSAEMLLVLCHRPTAVQDSPAMPGRGTEQGPTETARP